MEKRGKAKGQDHENAGARKNLLGFEGRGVGRLVLSKRLKHEDGKKTDQNDSHKQIGKVKFSRAHLATALVDASQQILINSQ